MRMVPLWERAAGVGGMKMVALKKCSRYIRGITFKPSDVVSPGILGSVVCMRTKNIQKNLDESDLIAVSSHFVHRSEQYIQEKDILISSANSWELVGKCVQVPRLPYTATAGGFISIVRADRSLVDPDYFFRWMSCEEVQHRIRLLGRKTTNISNLGVERFQSLEIPLPPLPEQKRIAAILDKADAIRRKRRQAMAMADQFLRSVFLEMFGDPVTNPKGWPVKTFADVSEKFSDGPFGSNLKSSHYVEEGVRVIRLQNIGIGELIDNDRAFISEEHFDSLQKHHCTPGDVIIGTLGDPNLRAFIIPDYMDRSLNKADCIQLRVDHTQATREYLCALLNQPGTLALASHLLHGQTRTRISMGTLKGLSIPVPSLHEQEKFSTIYLKTSSEKQKSIDVLNESDLLFYSVTQRAFRGEL